MDWFSAIVGSAIWWLAYALGHAAGRMSDASVTTRTEPPRAQLPGVAQTARLG